MSTVMRPKFSPDGRKVLTGSDDGTARLWDTESGSELAILQCKSRLRDGAFSPDGRRVVTASEDGTGRLWDVVSRRELAVLRGHTSYVEHVTFSPDGRKVASVSNDGTARLWDARSGDSVSTLSGYHVVVLSPDSRVVVTGGSPARLWDATSGHELGVLRGMDVVFGAAFTSDGRKVVTVGSDPSGGSAGRIYFTKLSDLLKLAESRLPVTLPHDKRDSLERR